MLFWDSWRTDDATHYWIALLEEERDGLLYAASFIFGAEPSNKEVYEFVQHEFIHLQRQMTVGVPSETKLKERKNPKRLQREIRQKIQPQAISTQAQAAYPAGKRGGKRTPLGTGSPQGQS